jgi:hypothetical protein
MNPLMIRNFDRTQMIGFLKTMRTSAVVHSGSLMAH